MRRVKTMTSLVMLVAIALATAGCFHAYGSRRYPGTPRYARSDYGYIELLRREPRRDHIRVGEVRLRPEPWMGRYEVEGILRERTARLGGDALVIVTDRYLRGSWMRRLWRGRRSVPQRQIVGIAIRYRR